jgi:hypothetical protein
MANLAAPMQSFGQDTNSSSQSLLPASVPPFPFPMLRRSEPSAGPAGLHPSGSWLQTGPRHYRIWEEGDQL